MRTSLIRRLSGLTLAALLLVPAIPATAEQSAPTASLDLQLEAALEARGSTFALAPESAAAVEETATAEINPSELRAAAWTLEEQDDPTAAMKPEKKKGWRRWLKKHWYVPVIAAVALGVALDSGDGDADGEED